MAKIRETINRLMALALADIPEEDTARTNEARNAAVQALKLISEHKLLDTAGVKKKKLPIELDAFDVQSLFQKLYVMDFDGAIAMVERFRKRTQKHNQELMKNLERDFRNEATWTEKTQHAARRSNATEQCAYCGGQILALMWIANPFRGDLTTHLRCFRERRERDHG